MNFKKFQIYRSKEALVLINSDAFVKQWKQLAVGLPVYCRMQEADMLCLWFKHYSVVFEPVIFTAYNDSDELVGFLGMAWNEKEQELRHAGHPQYFGWLAKPDYEVSFLQQVFRKIRDEFPINKLLWSVIPPGLSLDVFESALDSNMHMTCQETVSPMWDLSDPSRLKRLLKNKSIKSNFSKYRRRGDFRFEIIEEPDRLRKVLDIAKNQIDFRKEAMNNVLPFKSDPIKIGYYCEQITIPGTILPVALWLDEQLLSFNMGVMSDNYFQGRITSFDPSEYRNSPGTLLFIRLSEYLTEKGFEVFDLTPGTNSYKDRFADKSVKLFKPTIHFSTMGYQKTLIKKKLVKGSRRLLIDKLGLNIKSTRKWKTNIAELPQKIKKIGKSGTLINIDKGMPLFKQPKLIHWKQSNITPIHSELSKQVKIQQYEDLQKYQDTQPFLTRRGLLIDAQKKFAQGETLYSVSNDEKLLWYVWRKKVKGEIKYNNNTIPVPEDGVLIYDFYQHSSLKGEEYINNISEIIPILDLQDVDNIYLLEGT
ncbi:MAG: GNAT family N-acetyltransferase [Saprospiraceae bacterium]